MSFLTLLLYLFCTFIRPQEWIEPFIDKPLVEILSISTIILLIFERLSRGYIELVRVPQNRLMLGLFFSILMSHIVHTYFEGLTLAFNAFLIPFVLYFIILNGVNTELKFKIAIWLIVAMIFVLVPQGMYQLQNGNGWGGQPLTYDPHREEYRINWIGIFNDPNDLALLFVVAVGIVIAFLFGPAGWLLKLLSIPTLGYLCYGIYLTNSRGGMLALMATVFFYFIRRTKKFIFGGVVGGLCAFALLAAGPSRVGLISVEEESAYNRLDLWYEGFLMLKHNPLFGVGYGMFTDKLPQTAHNSFILAAAELGLIGLFFWMALIYSSFKCLSLVQANDGRLKTYALGLQSGLIGFCMAAFFLSRTYVILPYLLFAFSGSLFYIAQCRNKEMVFNFSREDTKKTIWLCVVVLLFAFILIKVGLK